jgi:pimeloyl-ACP methyl ester carboxylesterase
MSKLTISPEGKEPVELHYTDQGTGQPVVLIHGWPLSGRSWESQVLALVEAGYRAITYDRRGFGESTQPWNGYEYDTLAADLDALMTHLDLTDAALAGFSMGGGEVLRYISTYGAARVSKVALLSAVPPYLLKADDNPEGGLEDATIKQMQDGIRADRIAFFAGFFENFFGAGEKRDLVSGPQKAFALQIASLASPKGTLDCIDAFGRTDFRADMAKITVPTLVLHGDSDAIVPFEISGRRSAESISGSTLHIVKDGPHGVTASHPQEVSEVLLDFLGT